MLMLIDEDLLLNSILLKKDQIIRFDLIDRFHFVLHPYKLIPIQIFFVPLIRMLSGLASKVFQSMGFG